MVEGDTIDAFTALGGNLKAFKGAGISPYLGRGVAWGSGPDGRAGCQSMPSPRSNICGNVSVCGGGGKRGKAQGSGHDVYFGA